MDTSPIQGIVEPLNLDKIIKFNENLYSDLLKKDMTGQLSLTNAEKFYLIVPLKLAQCHQNS